MAEAQNIMSVSVTWRGKEFIVGMNANSILRELGMELQQLTNVKPDTMRLLVPQLNNKGSKLFLPFSAEHSSMRLREINVQTGKSIRMMGVFDDEIEEVSNEGKTDLRILGFEDEEKRLKAQIFTRPLASLRLPPGPYTFHSFRTLEIPGIELHPPVSEALKRMHMLASDPGIVAIMNKHHWQVGIMTEMAPVGYVGITPECILGFNKNHGQEISLRLRTDDLKGFRNYESIKKTLLHELAHMVYSEHDADFWALDKQLNEEAANLDWTKAKSYTLSGSKQQDHYEDEYPVVASASGHKLGGSSYALLVNPRLSSAVAAHNRLLSASASKEKEHEPDSDDSGQELVMEISSRENKIDTSGLSTLCENELDNSLAAKRLLRYGMDDSPASGAGKNSEPKILAETNLDKSGSNILDANMREPDPDDLQSSDDLKLKIQDHSFAKRLPETHEEPDPDDYLEAANVGSSEHGCGIGETNVTPFRSVLLSDRQVTEVDTSSQYEVHAERQAPDQELQRITEPASLIYSRLQHAIENLRSEATPAQVVPVLQTLSTIIRNVIEHPDDMKYRKLRKANPVFQRNVANYRAAMEILSVVGFQEDLVLNERGVGEAYVVLKRNDPALLWLAKSSLEMCTA